VKRIGFSVEDEIKKLDKSKANDNAERREPPRLKVQRVGTDFVEFFLESPTNN
jgi:hypothetical protein